MPEIKFPDGKKISFSKNVDGFEIANKISNLAREMELARGVEPPTG